MLRTRGLCPLGESKRKHVLLLELMGSQWRTIKLPLTTVRPFKWDHLVLAAAQPPLDPEDSAAITAHLERKVRVSCVEWLLINGALNTLELNTERSLYKGLA